LKRETWANITNIPADRIYTDNQLVGSLQAGYPGFGKTIGSMKTPGDCVWQPLDGAVLNLNNNQHMAHHQPGEHSLPGMMD
jgi:hypothetical protein